MHSFGSVKLSILGGELVRVVRISFEGHFQSSHTAINKWIQHWCHPLDTCTPSSAYSTTTSI